MSAEPLSLDEKKLKSLEKFASVFLSLEELEVLMQLPPDTLVTELTDEQSPVSKAINRGRLQRKAKLRAAILLSAEQGSSPAQTLAMQMLKEMDSKDG